ncbi:MAG TPA: DUF6111 family protein [Alphaproteobacteria bacterium]|nr:DUF6111 family protein [Alphaproteobacteria bacterium]
MIRIIIENLLLFLLPTLVYVAYVLMTRPEEEANGAAGKATLGAHVLDNAPLLWLFGAGAALVIVTLVAFGSISGGKPGQHYEPPAMKDGRIEPGHLD